MGYQPEIHIAQGAARKLQKQLVFNYLQDKDLVRPR
jgi:hypothetical protein